MRRRIDESGFRAHFFVGHNWERMKRLLAPVFLLVFAAAATKPSPPPDVAAPPADAQKSSTGLYTKQLAPPAGTQMPSDDDLVKIRYTIFASDGRLMDWIAPPQFVVVAVNTMTPGMKEEVEMMHVGETRRAWIPEALGARGKVDKGGWLVADVELLDAFRIPTTPADVYGIPADATKTKSGLAYKILRHGKSTQHPKASDRVVVNYSGWTTTGHMFDSSVLRGEPAEFPLGEVIPGWREGIQLLTVGEKARIWIPETLAYKGQAGKPQGMLVFDVELLGIK